MNLKKLLKTTSLFVALVAMTGGSLIQPASAKSASPSNTFVTKDLATGAESTITVPQSTTHEDISKITSSATTSSAVSFQPDMHINDIIGNDDRTLVTNTTTLPYSAICRLEIRYPKSSDPYIGTACLITSDIAITAAHCLYDEELGGFATSVTIYPGGNGSTSPYGYTTSKTLTIPTDFKENSDPEHDYGAIKLNSRISSCGHLNALDGDRYIKGASEILTAGYPQTGAHKMYQCKGNITSYDDDTLEYDMDCTGGQSGSPILAKYNNKYIVVGIHGYGHASYNSGVRYTSEFDDLVNKVLDQD